MSLIYLSSAWVAGIYLGSKIALPLSIICLGLLPLCLIPFLSQYKKALLFIGLCLFAFLGGSLCFQSNLLVVDEHHLQFYNDQEVVEIDGMICSDPEARDTTSIFQLSASELRINDEKKQVSGKTLIRVPRYPEYHYGDVLKVTGKLETPPQINDFDYKGYLARQGIYSITYYPKIEILDTGKGSKPLAWIYSLRNRLSQSLSLALPEPQGSLAQGIFLGLRGDIPYSLRQVFSRTGTAHLLAISGLCRRGDGGDQASDSMGCQLSANFPSYGRAYLPLSLFSNLGEERSSFSCRHRGNCSIFM